MKMQPQRRLGPAASPFEHRKCFSHILLAPLNIRLAVSGSPCSTLTTLMSVMSTCRYWTIVHILLDFLKNRSDTCQLKTESKQFAAADSSSRPLYCLSHCSNINHAVY